MSHHKHFFENKTIVISVFLVITLSLYACAEQIQDQKQSDCTYSQVQSERLYGVLPTDSPQVVLIGNSLVSRGHWNNLLAPLRVMNFGIGGDEIPCIRNRVRRLTTYPPSRWVIEAGINDVQLYSMDTIISCYHEIIQLAKNNRSGLVIVSCVGVGEAAGSKVNDRKEYLEVNTLVQDLNYRLQSLAAQNNIAYLDLNKIISNASGCLMKENTIDGVHLSDTAYVLWANMLKSEFLQ